jgi:hypothetical protein
MTSLPDRKTLGTPTENTGDNNGNGGNNDRDLVLSAGVPLDVERWGASLLFVFFWEGTIISRPRPMLMDGDRHHCAPTTCIIR